MSKYENLNVNYRFTLWDKITNTLIETLELIIHINNLDIRNRKTNFEKLEQLFERLVIFINITNDLKLFWNSSKFLIYIETLVKVKKMVKCWNK